MNDPFGTASLRAAVLDAWASSPTRFREDANAEEDLCLGGYADAWFVELAQNAADAARAAGVPGRIVVALVDGELRVANTGTPLDAAGVAALASLRASAKRDTDSVGRFGVGFAAVLAVTDAPRVLSRTGGIAFSAARTIDAVADLPAVVAELARRDEPPVLRLAWPVDGEPGLDTEVRMPLRPGVDGGALLASAAAEAADLLLALPDLVEITVGGTVVTRADDGDVATIATRVDAGSRDDRWRLAGRTGRLERDADGAVEQRGRRDWSATWALPLDRALIDDEVLYAPTATGERLGLPARLVATVPMEPDRRRARTGPGTDAVLAGAVDAYLDLVRATPPAERAALVPEPGFPRSPLDGRLREGIVEALRRTAWLPGADGSDLVPARARWLDLPDPGDLLALLGFADLTAAPPPVALDVERLSAAGLVERLTGVDRPPTWWKSLYAALAPLVGVVPGLSEDLRALPVPLADGRVALGPPTVLLPSGVAFGVSLPGLHLAHPDAVHPLLARLGATTADARTLLEHPALLAAVESSLDDADAGLDVRPLAEAVLALVAQVGTVDGCGALALPADDGLPARADELMLPDAALAPLLGDDPPLGVVDAPWADRAALVAVGVLDGFALVVDEEPTGPDHDLDDEERWWDSLPEPPRRLVAVRDLDLVDDDAWSAALALLGAGRETREALSGGYTAWWLARHARLDGRRPDHWRLPSAHGI
ncbi:sacsin N-terminal ATP-binding-like domain-containing protein, partial [Pseudonocardia abyssalis]